MFHGKGLDLTDGRKGALARRNKGFDATHQAIIEAAVRIISEKGVEALSMAAISRAVGINRTTLYYHFEGRDALIAAVKHWSSEQLTRGFNADLPREERTEHIARFVLENGALIKLFLDDFLAPGDIRERYPQWDALVRGVEGDIIDDGGEAVDAEIYCVMLLTSAFIAPRVYRNSVRSDLGTEEIVERFCREQMRVLRRDGLVKD